MKTPTSEASPAKTLLEEMKNFRVAGHGTLEAVRANFDTRLDRLQSLVENVGAADDIPPRQLRDIRDMLTILSDPRMKPPKGRLKDLKKMESIPDDLEMMVERWE